MAEENIGKKVDEDWKEAAKKAADSFQQKTEADVPAVDFVNFITTLALQAMVFLGALPNPVSQKKEDDLTQARFIIDTLIMLKEKTAGNLAPDETKILENFIYELQMKFVEKQGHSEGSGKEVK